MSKLCKQEEFNAQERSSHNLNLGPAGATFAMLVKSKTKKTQATKSTKSEPKMGVKRKKNLDFDAKVGKEGNESSKIEARKEFWFNWGGRGKKRKAESSTAEPSSGREEVGGGKKWHSNPDNETKEKLTRE